MNERTSRKRTYVSKGNAVNLTQRRLEFGTDIRLIHSANVGSYASPKDLAPFRNTHPAPITPQHLNENELLLFNSVLGRLNSLRDPKVSFSKVPKNIDLYLAAGALSTTGLFSAVSVIKNKWYRRLFFREPTMCLHAIPTIPTLQNIMAERDQVKIKAREVITNRTPAWFLSEPHCPISLKTQGLLGQLKPRTIEAIHYCFIKNIYLDLITLGQVYQDNHLYSEVDQLLAIVVSLTGKRVSIKQESTIKYLLNEGKITNCTLQALNKVITQSKKDSTKFCMDSFLTPLFS
jgi:hypothetical protein